MFRLKLQTVVRPVSKSTHAGTVTVKLLYKRKFCHLLSLYIFCSYTTCDNRSVPTVSMHTALLTLCKFNRHWVSFSGACYNITSQWVQLLQKCPLFNSSKNFQNPKRGLSCIVNGSTAQACIIIINNYNFNKLVQFSNLYVCTNHENLTLNHQYRENKTTVVTMLYTLHSSTLNTV